MLTCKIFFFPTKECFIIVLESQIIVISFTRNEKPHSIYFWLSPDEWQKDKSGRQRIFLAPVGFKVLILRGFQIWWIQNFFLASICCKVIRESETSPYSYFIFFFFLISAAIFWSFNRLYAWSTFMNENKVLNSVCPFPLPPSLPSSLLPFLICKLLWINLHREKILTNDCKNILCHFSKLGSIKDGQCLRWFWRWICICISHSLKSGFTEGVFLRT